MTLVGLSVKPARRSVGGNNGGDRESEKTGRERTASVESVAQEPVKLVVERRPIVRHLAEPALRNLARLFPDAEHGDVRGPPRFDGTSGSLLNSASACRATSTADSNSAVITSVLSVLSAVHASMSRCDVSVLSAAG